MKRILLILLVLSFKSNAQCGFRNDYIVWVKSQDTTRRCHRDTPKVDLKKTKMIKPVRDTSKSFGK